jgi:4'-phosphopantetheinyl transferase
MLHRPHHTLGAHEVHVWHLCADRLPDQQVGAGLHTLLSPEEQDRMACYRHDADRTLYLLSRGLMRSVLASYLGCACRDVRFTANDFGKPILHADCCPFANARSSEKLHFNLTHSRGAVALAVSNGREVGIDIEKRGRSVEFLPLAERFFSASEANHLKGLPTEKLGEAFFAIWTLKEAFVKGIGRGLSFPLDAFCFDLEGDRFLRFRPLADFVSPDWHFQQFDLGERHCGAVAVQGDGAQIHMRDWALAFLA